MLQSPVSAEHRFAARAAHKNDGTGRACIQPHKNITLNHAKASSVMFLAVYPQAQGCACASPFAACVMDGNHPAKVGSNSR